MAYRLVTRLIVAILLSVFLTTCATGSSSRLYNLCFTHHPQVPSVEYVPYNYFSSPKNCARHPGIWNQDFPIEVVAPPDALDDVRDMAIAINEEVGRELLQVRMRRVYETIDNPDHEVVVWFHISGETESLCKKRGKKQCLGYTHYWFKRGKYYSTITLYDQILKSSTQRRGVVKHELLHALGFKHAKSPTDAMYKSWGPGDSEKTISPEDLKILREL